jgi:hypothetical protein
MDGDQFKCSQSSATVSLAVGGKDRNPTPLPAAGRSAAGRGRELNTYPCASCAACLRRPSAASVRPRRCRRPLVLAEPVLLGSSRGVSHEYSRRSEARTPGLLCYKDTSELLLLLLLLTPTPRAPHSTHQCRRRCRSLRRRRRRQPVWSLPMAEEETPCEREEEGKKSEGARERARENAVGRELRAQPSPGLPARASQQRQARPSPPRLPLALGARPAVVPAGGPEARPTTTISSPPPPAPEQTD